MVTAAVFCVYVMPASISLHRLWPHYYSKYHKLDVSILAPNSGHVDTEGLSIQLMFHHLFPPGMKSASVNTGHIEHDGRLLRSDFSHCQTVTKSDGTTGRTDFPVLHEDIIILSFIIWLQDCEQVNEF